MILQIETSTQVCSCALSLKGEFIGCKDVLEPNAHAEQLTLLIQDLMQAHGVTWPDIQAIAVSKGPGSYTGLRIGVSTAKGLCYALNIPLIGVSTLHSMAEGFLESQNVEEAQLLVPMIDARRREVYQTILTSNLETIEEISASIIDSESYTHLKRPVVLFGNGANKFSDTFDQTSMVQVFTNFELSARFMSRAAFEKYQDKAFEDLAYFEPFYLKDFVATTPKKRT